MHIFVCINLAILLVLVTSAAPLSFSSCDPKCFDHGTCNPEAQRCECPLLWHGSDCGIPFSEPQEQCRAYGHDSLAACGSGDLTRCLNGCHGRGWCEGGFCLCRPGYYGADCALSLGPDGRPELLAEQGYQTRQHGVKIYVYELPPMTNTWMSIARLDRPLVAVLLQRLLSAGVRTPDGDAADFYFIPLVMRSKKAQATAHMSSVLYYIRRHWPWWDRSGGGHRHLLVLPTDLGRRSIPEDQLRQLQNVTFLTHWGLHTNHSAGGWLESHRPGQDIVVPPLHSPDDPVVFSPLHVEHRRRKRRSRGLFFAGRICGDGRPPLQGRCADSSKRNTRPSHSTRTRQQVSEHHWNRTGWTLTTRTKAYANALSTHTFCLAPASSSGGGGRRGVQALVMGCVPVLVGDGVYQPFEPEIDWTKFSVSAAEADIPRLHRVLESINDTTVMAMQERLWCAAQHMYYSSTFGEVMGEDGRFDAFETLMEVLRMRREYPGLEPRQYAARDRRFNDFISCKLPPTGGRVRLCSQSRLVKSSRTRPCREQFPGLPMRAMHSFYSWPGGAVCGGMNASVAACPRSWI